MPYGVVCFLQFYAGSTERPHGHDRLGAGVECNMHLTGKCCITQRAILEQLTIQVRVLSMVVCLMQHLHVRCTQLNKPADPNTLLEQIELIEQQL